jgi:hypothetical protein
MRLFVESDMAIATRLKQWRKFFSILPRKVSTNDPNKDCWVWLETIERRVIYYYLGDYVINTSNDYRLIEKE